MRFSRPWNKIGPAAKRVTHTHPRWWLDFTNIIMLLPSIGCTDLELWSPWVRAMASKHSKPSGYSA